MKKALLIFACLFLVSFDQYIVVTTIQYPTPQMRKMAQIPGWRLVVVGDKKTPSDWHLDNCEYLSPERQSELGYEIAKLLPWNHYSRKNIGYLFAIEQGAKIIYETDDDNEVIGLLSFCPSLSLLPSLHTEGNSLNIYGYFGHPEIWPRGFPLDQIHPPRPFEAFPPEEYTIGIEQGVVNGSPDVDAIFRLTQDRDVQFEAKPACVLPRGIFCPFNSQNTFVHPIAFFTMYLPSRVSMRVSDIWRGYIAQSLMWKSGACLVFSGPSAIQERNKHSLLQDFYLEQALYLQSHKLIKHLSQWDLLPPEDPFTMMTGLYQDLVQAQFFPPEEMELLKAWLHDLARLCL